MRSELACGALAVLVAATCFTAGCKRGRGQEPAEAQAPVARFAAVEPPAASAASSRFCEKTYPATGPAARRFTPGPTRPLPGGASAAAPAAPSPGAWTWLNVWATWCKPCIAEMGLLARWQAGLQREGRTIALDLLSVDAADAEDALGKAIAGGLPGPVRWLRSPEDLGPLLDGLGVARGAALPVHALVDPAGMVRCVRVGAIHDRDYGAVKALLGG